MGLKLSVARSNDAAFDQLLLGWAQALALDDVVLGGLIATSRNPTKYRLLPDVLKREAIGIAFAPGDEELALLVRDAVVGISIPSSAANSRACSRSLRRVRQRPPGTKSSSIMR